MPNSIERCVAALDVATTTSKKYAECLTYIFRWMACEGLEIETLGVPEFRRFREAKQYSNAYQRVCLVALKHYLRWRSLDDHPLINYRIEMKEGRAPRAFHPEEMEQIIASIDDSTPIGKRDRAIIRLLYDTLIRATELCRLQLADVDLQHCQLSVLAKGGNWETKAFTERTRDLLLEWIRIRTTIAVNGTSTLFCSMGGTRPGTPLTRWGLVEVFRYLGEKQGIRISPHDLRRSGIIAMALNGASVPVMMKQSGHKNPMVFMTYLRRLTVDDIRPYLPKSEVKR